MTTNVSETIVPIKKLNNFMQHCGLLPSTPFPQRLNNRTIMTSPENTLSNMYTAFVYSKKNSKVYTNTVFLRTGKQKTTIKN